MYGYTPEALAQVARLNQDARLIRVTSPLESDAFIVHRMHGREALSRPFHFAVDLLSPDALLELKQVVGQPMRLTLQRADGGERHFHGYVREFARTGTDGGLAAYRAELVPWLAFLDYASDCRIFQDQSVIDTVEAVFARYADIAVYRYELDAARYRPRPYCVQYNESDLAFVSRLLEDAGIHYRFEHDADGHVLVLSDDSTASPPIGDNPVVAFHADDGVQNERGLDLWSTRRRIGSNAHALKSFDFKQPRSALAVDRPLDTPHGILPRLETYVYDGAASYGDSRIGEALATLRAEEAAWQTKLFTGAGNHRGLQAGRHFVLRGHFEHAEIEEDARRFLLLEVEHDIRNNFRDGFTHAEGASCRCTVTALRRKIPFRPQRATPQPRMAGPQTATVAGPPGEEIHADRYGRVKVQFHWDRQGRFDDASSCWVRVASPWAGSGMGGVSAPRIGQEVVVDFLDGNPSRPIIVGRMFNEDNMPPFGLEVSGLKSRTVKGEGYNEVTMHDGAGAELLNLRAQRDMATTVLNDQNSAVRNNKSTTVDNNHHLSVGVNQDIAVGANRGVQVKGNDQLAVTGNADAAITGSSSTRVTGAVTQTYQAGQTLTIASAGYSEAITGSYRTRLTGDYSSQRSGDWSEDVTGTSKRQVAGAVTETLGAGRTVNVKGSDVRGVDGAVEDSNRGARTVSVDGPLEQVAAATFVNFAQGDMSLGSASKVVAAVGGSGVEITGSAITISAAGSTIVIDASGVSINGATINLN